MSRYTRAIGILALVQAGFIAILIAAPHGSAITYTAVALALVTAATSVWCAWLEDRSHRA